MSSTRSGLTLMVGWLCLLFAIMLIVFGVFMFLLQTPPATAIAFGCLSLFPGLIAVACLIPSKRTVALRMIGGIVFLASFGTLIATFVKLGDGNIPYSRRGLLLVVALAGGTMAIKGRWPGSEEQPSPTKAPDSSHEATD